LSEKRKRERWGDIALAAAQLNPQSDHYDEELAEKRALASISGRKSQAIGADFEETLAMQIRQLDIDGIAILHKTGPVTKVIGVQPNGRLDIVYKEDGPCDYIGAAFGCTVAFEAKSTSRVDIWSVPDKDIHQYEFMVNVTRHAPDAYTGYLIRWTKWEEVRWHSLYGTKYVREEGMLLPGGKLKYVFIGG
jgi:hypothetical protein